MSISLLLVGPLFSEHMPQHLLRLASIEYGIFPTVNTPHSTSCSDAVPCCIDTTVIITIIKLRFGGNVERTIMVSLQSSSDSKSGLPYEVLECSLLNCGCEGRFTDKAGPPVFNARCISAEASSSGGLLMLVR